MKNFVLLALALGAIFAACNSSHAAPPPLGAPAVAAYDKLHRTETFALGGVGRAGTTSKGERALRQLEREKNAGAAFVALLGDKTTTKAGKLYALLGLKDLKSAQFKKRLPAFLKDNSWVSEQSGCLVMRTKVKEIAARFADTKDSTHA